MIWNNIPQYIKFSFTYKLIGMCFLQNPMYACNGVCEKYRAISKMKSALRYKNGQKWCSQCTLFMEYEGLRCPCCSVSLRINPKSRKSKKLRPEMPRM